jgi:hypothetical protein
MPFFAKRSSNWWIFSILPFILFLSIILFLLLINKDLPSLTEWSQQFLYYSIILLSSEIGIRLIQDTQKLDLKLKEAGGMLVCLIISVILLTALYSNAKMELSKEVLFLFASFSTALYSIRVSSQNPYSGVDNFDLVNQRLLVEKDLSQKIKNGSSSYNGVKID